MREEITLYLDIAREEMQEAILHLENVLSKIRAGKSNPQMLRTVSIDYYGVITPLSQASNISTPDSQTLLVQPFDKTLVLEIEKAIKDANLGFNPSNNGEKVIINLPPLSEERRKALVKQGKAENENTKISIRNSRQRANEEIRKLAKSGFSEDLLRDAEAEVQELTNIYSNKADEIYTA